MRYFLSPSHDAAYNQALEERLYLAYPGEAFLLLWRNRPAVVCGKFQNIYQEVNLLEAQDQGVALVRRISGGGTVYHDLGNINYSLIGRKEGLGANYQPILEKICASLALLGAEVEILDEISLGVAGGTAGLKISGSAQATSQDRLVHHGTLLYDSDLSALQRLANGHNQNFSTRGTRSVPWPVANLRDHLHPDLGDSQAFLEAWLAALQQVLGAQEEFHLTEEDRQAIDQLYHEKYTSWTWTFAQGPAFGFSRDLPSQNFAHLDRTCPSLPSSHKVDQHKATQANPVRPQKATQANLPSPVFPTQISYTVKKGIIQDFVCQPACPDLSASLVGLQLEPQLVQSKLDQLGYSGLLPYLFS